MVFYNILKINERKKTIMSFQFCSISSGSKGNCYFVKAGETVLLIDAGISGKKIFEGLKAVGVSPEEVDGVLITHEHSDHVKGVKMVCKKSEKALVYANQATWDKFVDEKFKDRHRVINTNEKFYINDIEIMPFSIHHDAVEPVGYSITYKDRKLSVVTDTGHISDEIYEEIKDADLLVLESNHEVNVLKMCSYPYKTKMRILGDYGHLSNVAAAQCLCDILEDECNKKQCKTVLLAHLSKENNTPGMAKLAMKNILEERGLLSSEKVNLEVITQDKQSEIYTV